MKAGVDRLLRHLKAPPTAVVKSVFTDWPTLVGDLIGSHSRPIEIVAGTLHIEVDDPAWAAELSWLADDLIRKIQSSLDTNEINEIRVRIRR